MVGKILIVKKTIIIGRKDNFINYDNDYQLLWIVNNSRMTKSVTRFTKHKKNFKLIILLKDSIHK